MAKATLTQIMDFFGYFDADGKRQAAKFRTEWMQLSENERAAIAEGIGDGSLTY